MTAPVPETLEREQGKLWVSDAELICRLGVPEKIARGALRMLDRDAGRGFPRKESSGVTVDIGWRWSPISTNTTWGISDHIKDQRKRGLVESGWYAELVATRVKEGLSCGDQVT